MEVLRLFSLDNSELEPKKKTKKSKKQRRRFDMFELETHVIERQSLSELERPIYSDQKCLRLC